jgi:hypothetical protein
MTIDLAAAREFIYANARLLDRHRAAVLFDGAPADLVVQTLRAYHNADGGFGHALEPDVRTPHSETTAALHGLEVLAEVDALDDPMVKDVAGWVARHADPDGGVPFVLQTAMDYPRGPWMVPSDGGSHLTFGLAAILDAAEVHSPWLDSAKHWCWTRIEQPAEISAYWVKFALDFLDGAADESRASAAFDRLRPLLRADGSVPVPGGTAEEKLTPLTLSPRARSRSRSLFTEEQITADLNALEAGQQDDGGWTFDFLGWSPGQTAEWRGLTTLRSLATLLANDGL